MKFDSIIIGAGISGLVAAHRLKKMGRNILLVESRDRAGGVIQSVDAEGFLIEKGPNSLRGTHEFLDLIEELDLTNELVTADPRAPAYVYADGELQPVPMSPPALIKTKLISNSAKLRLLREPFIKTRSEDGEESIASFVRRRLGDEVLERLVAPFLSGVYAGDPEQLSIQACFPRLAGFESGSGSIMRGALQSARASRKERGKPKRSLRPYRLCSFRRGLQVLPQSLAKAVGESLLTEARVKSIKKMVGPAPARSSRFIVALEHENKQRTLEAATLVIAAPSFAAARLLNECAPDVSALIAEITYASLVSLPLAYPVERVARKLDGFGFLAPREEGLRTLGSIWNSSLFAERAPDGWICATNFIGGATDPHAVELSDEELVGIVHNELRKVLGIEGEPLRLPITRYERAIPQYNIGHRERIAKVEAALHNYRGLSLAGNYLHGVSLGDCIKQAELIAAEVNRQSRNGAAER
jgi:protoporphyrinogen/coproporphyrinogen III oxidase